MGLSGRHLSSDGLRTGSSVSEGPASSQLAALRETSAPTCRIHDFLVEHRAERGDIIVAFGRRGGRYAGFVAATFNRGMQWCRYLQMVW